MGLFHKIGAAFGRSLRPLAFEAGRSQRRLRALPGDRQAINVIIRSYGRTVLARSRFLAANNPYAAQAKEEFTSALVGSGIKPSSLVDDAALRATIQLAWLDWTDEADADGLTDLYGLEAMIAAEMFEAGECFVRFRPRRPGDFTVPFQLQILPAEMLPLDLNRDLGSGRRIECGIEFGPIGDRRAYHFLRRHPGDDQSFNAGATQYTIVPAEQVLHLYRPIRAGQIRGIPHTVSGIVASAIHDGYEDAESERKRMAAMFMGFVEQDAGDPDAAVHPMAGGAPNPPPSSGPAPTGDWGMEPGATVDLRPGQKMTFSNPADVGPNYEAFMYRQLLKIAAGYGVPYAAMTGDLRQTSYGSIRAGLVAFRRRIEALQHHVMVFQFCRPVWQRWMDEAVLAGVLPISPADYEARRTELQRVKWMPPKWEWIDPLKDLAAEKVAVDSGFKARSDVIEANGYDPEETDARIAADQERAARLGIKFNDQTGTVALTAAMQIAQQEEQQQQQQPPAQSHNVIPLR